MPEADARGVFGIIRKMGGDFQIEPSVKWIVVAEPLVCPTWRPMCNRIGPGFGKPDHRGCPHCNGTGLPDVQIVSHTTIVAGWDVQHRVLVTEHGVVTIGAAVPIVSMTSASADDFDLDRFILAPVRRGGTIVMPVLSDGVEYLITDEFGAQDVAAGAWAHPVTVVS